MKAVILAAGVGSRLEGAGGEKPKVLFEFGGKSLLKRHLELLGRIGVHEVALAVGYRADLIAAELAAIEFEGELRTMLNPDYEQGSVVTLRAAAEALEGGFEVILMDADVLYDRRLLERLRDTSHANCFLLDRDIEPGDEPMKLAVRDGALVEFARRVDVACDFTGESVGFFRLSPGIARRLSAACKRLIEQDRREEGYEEALREVLLASPPGTFGYEDITGLPWTEIDFPDDLRHAEEDVLPRLLDEDR